MLWLATPMNGVLSVSVLISVSGSVMLVSESVLIELTIMIE